MVGFGHVVNKNWVFYQLTILCQSECHFSKRKIKFQIFTIKHPRKKWEFILHCKLRVIWRKMCFKYETTERNKLTRVRTLKSDEMVTSPLSFNKISLTSNWLSLFCLISTIGTGRHNLSKPKIWKMTISHAVVVHRTKCGGDYKSQEWEHSSRMLSIRTLAP